MDQIVKVIESHGEPEGSSALPTHSDRQLEPAGGTCNYDKTVGKASERGFTSENKDEASKVLSIYPPMVKPVSSSTVHSKFVINQRVVLQPVDNTASIKGSVRWVGPVKTSKASGGLIIPVVGIETVSSPS